MNSRTWVVMVFCGGGSIGAMGMVAKLAFVPAFSSRRWLCSNVRRRKAFLCAVWTKCRYDAVSREGGTRCSSRAIFLLTRRRASGSTTRWLNVSFISTKTMRRTD